jgi:hypothetical protein
MLTVAAGLELLFVLSGLLMLITVGGGDAGVKKGV